MQSDPANFDSAKEWIIKRIVTSLNRDAFSRNGATRELEGPVSDREHTIQQLRRGEFLYARCDLRGGKTEIVYVDPKSEAAWDDIQARVQAAHSEGDITSLAWYAVQRVVHKYCTTEV